MSRRPSPLDNEQCRQCTSFADYMKENKKKYQKENQANDEEVCLPEDAPVKQMRSDCPLDKDQLGNKSWGLLHTIAAKYPDNPTDDNKKDITTFFSVFSKLYPCEHCAEDLRKDICQNPPNVESQKELSNWLCELHNRVNVKIGKEKFDCSRVNERWRDGWLDGSCDM